MQKRTTANGVANFLKVAGAAFLHPTRLITGGVAVAAAVALPPIALPALIAGGLAILGMSWADINDPDFIARVLKPASQDKPSYSKRLQNLVNELHQQIDEREIYPEVKVDVNEAVDAIEKIMQVISYLPAEDQGSIDFVIDQLEKLTTRLANLLQKEQLARKFLQTEDLNGLHNDLQNLRRSLESISDKIAKREIQKAIAQKNEQIDNHNQVEQRLARIDAYIANIRAALYTTYSNLARLQLKDEYVLVDEADVLTDSIKQVVNEIDSFESSAADIDIGSQPSTKKQKQAQTN